MQLLRSLLVVMVLVLVPTAARAACAALPYTFTNGTSTIDATTTNANNNALRTCVTTIDATQIGTGGIYASQIIPTTNAQATFGGTQPYAFPTTAAFNAGLTSTTGTFTGAVTAAGLSSTTGAFSAALAGNTLASNGARVDVAGDIGTSESATAGRVFFGQSTTAKTFDYGVTTAATFTLAAPLTVYGTVESRQSASAGIHLFGDLGAGGLDYNFCNVSAFSFTTQPCSGIYRAVDGGAYSNLSDRRAKRNIQPLQNALRIVSRLRPVRFRWRSDGHGDVGFIAQDVQPILPDLVHRDRAGSYLLNYSGIIPVLVRAIQQQQREIDSLRANRHDPRR